MEQQNIATWATVLNTARINGKPVPQISPQVSSFPRSSAYAIQEAQQKTRLQAGETQVGWKMGLTSEAKRRQMNLDSPLYGFLTDRMQVVHGGRFPLKGSIHPKIEPEVAFWIKKDLSGKVSREEVLGACAGVASCLEILDSRYEQFKYFSMEDVISDNSSSSHFIVGPWREDFQTMDLKNLSMEMWVDGALSQKGISSDISGDPVVSVQQLCELLADRGQVLKSGSIVLAGAATTAVELKPGMKIELKVDQLKPVTVEVTP
jgi:2-oxo-3-hexenedioate decarboxylase